LLLLGACLVASITVAAPSATQMSMRRFFFTLDAASRPVVFIAASALLALFQRCICCCFTPALPSVSTMRHLLCPA